MSFRTRLVLAFGLVALVPLTVLVVGVRREMTARLNRQAVSRVDAQADLLRNNLARLHQATRDRLRRYSQELAGSNQFRLAMMAGDTGARRWLIDWAVSAMEASQFGMLQVQDSAGMILSSGHFRNQFGRVDRVFEPWAERSAANGVLIDATTPDGHIRVLAAMDSFQFAGRRYLVTGGPPFDLAQVIATDDPEVSATLALGDAASGPATDPVLARITLPYLAQLDSTSPDAATIVVTRLPDPMLALRRSVDRWFLAAIVIVVSLSLALAIGIAARVSRPLQELAAKTEKVDLDRLEQDFATDRNDEIGTLSRLLGGMTTRLRASTERIRDAERRAVTGDLARQVNHDIK
ncbi:MAG: HAMP domain-containing protein, partial [Gemmatimonadota bacterium]